MAARFSVESGDGVRQLVDLFKRTPERLDKDMRASFRALAVKVRDDARARARGDKPTGKRPQRKGKYTWNKLVNSITSGAESDTPIIKLGSASVPGWAGWEFGSDRFPQFGNRRKEGNFFFPTVLGAIPEMNEAVQKVVDDYVELFAKL